MAIISTSKLITIDRHFAEQENLHPEATGEFTDLLHDLILAYRILAMEVRRAGINDILGMTGITNFTGDKVKSLMIMLMKLFSALWNAAGNSV